MNEGGGWVQMHNTVKKNDIITKGPPFTDPGRAAGPGRELAQAPS